MRVKHSTLVSVRHYLWLNSNIIGGILHIQKKSRLDSASFSYEADFIS